MNRILVVGCRGMLGTDLMELLSGPAGARHPSDSLGTGAVPAGSAAAPAPAEPTQPWPLQVRGLDLPDIDITSRASINRALKEFRPQVLVNCAAYTRVDDAEKDLDAAMHVNGIAPGLLAAGCAAARIKLVHISTDFVFDGGKDGPYVEDDPPHPLSAYGATKLEGERRIAASGGDWLIVRTAWLYGAHGKNFVTTIQGLARTKPELTVVNDQRGCPTWTRDLSRALWALMQVGGHGIVHAVGRGTCTWYDFACEIVKQSGLSTPVRPVTTAEFPRPARRPANSALDTSKLKGLAGFEFPPWPDSLAAFLAELGK